MLGSVADHRLANGGVVGNGVRLIEKPDAKAAHSNNLARIGLGLTSECPNQRGFAVTVATHDTDAIAVRETYCDVL
jgi:hypothetical protein